MAEPHSAAVSPAAAAPPPPPKTKENTPQPQWHSSIGGAAGGYRSGLKVYNSLTCSKVDFVPKTGRDVTWYCCGPTVYNVAHMGHARTYVTFDYVRRIMEEYFNYNVFYVMNVTDVDDKIILKGNQQLLENLFKSISSSLSSSPSSQFPSASSDPALSAALKTAQSLIDPATKSNISRLADAISQLRQAARPFVGLLTEQELNMEAPYVEVARFFEADFLDDITKLGVKHPDVLTRVTEFIPEIIEFIERIQANGFAYEANGSLYFDTQSFRASGHDYGKLEPWSVDNTSLVEEGEGELSVQLAGADGKKSSCDFALWKRSKPGEPKWPSPWGEGRPGWHIECSTMASRLLGDNIDIHVGGCDLRFPHHDNELAQSEAYFNNRQWINYFLHTGHLDIGGRKMSKSLKNFVTVKDALQLYNARQIRMLFLSHRWDSRLDYSDETMKHAVEKERFFNEFFQNIKSQLRSAASASSTSTAASDSLQKWDEEELQLHGSLGQTKRAVHEALCDNFDTPTALEALRNLVSAVNVYLQSKSTPKQGVAKDEPRAPLLRSVAAYVTRMFRIFGLVSDDIGFSLASGDNLEVAISPYLEAFASFRDGVRVAARTKQEPAVVLRLCDTIRDDVLPQLGVRLEDKPDGKAVWKLEDRESLLRERERQKQIEREKQEKKDAARRKEEEKRQAKAARAAAAAAAEPSTKK